MDLELGSAIPIRAAGIHKNLGDAHQSERHKDPKGADILHARASSKKETGSAIPY